MHLGGEPGEIAAGDVGGRAVFVGVAGELQHRLEKDLRVLADGLEAPQVPAPFVVGKVLLGDRNVFAGRGGAAGQREHQDLGIRQERLGVAGHHPANVRFQILVTPHRHASAVIGDIANACKAVIPAKRGVAVIIERAEQQFPLDHLGSGTRLFKPRKLAVERLGEGFAKQINEGAAEFHGVSAGESRRPRPAGSRYRKY